ncbi:MAG: hypothetical protein QME69_10770, partial [Candidatus Saccharicenans sp.]|nr:hypothetical protein [Candidatus Saccharicenans sp.]
MIAKKPALAARNTNRNCPAGQLTGSFMLLWLCRKSTAEVTKKNASRKNNTASALFLSMDFLLPQEDRFCQRP